MASEKYPYSDSKIITVDGNYAASHVAYLNSEVIALYPITPSSPMGEAADSMSTEGKTNIYGTVPKISELQSEAGAAGAIHSALSAGSQASTFTASQGLLLMIPNMYKIAGELTPTVFHVSARSLSCDALSIFGDHSDVTAVRSTGFGLSASGNSQEVMDIAAITVRTSLKSRIPFIHFFDGFRTSHEIRKIRELPEEFFREFIDPCDVYDCRLRALDPRHADLRGTAENPDIYFQGRETVNTYYLRAPEIYRESCDLFFRLTGRLYKPYQYYGDPEADSIIILMGSGADTAEKTIEILNRDSPGKYGLIKVHLFRPFDGSMLVDSVPESVKRIAVLDRTKEPGSIGEPLYLDVNTAITNAVRGMHGYRKIDHIPLVIGGRYGLGSKEFTPGMVEAVLRHLEEMDRPGSKIWSGFTVGINDDVTHTSLDYREIYAENEDSFRGKFFGLGADGTVGANKNSIKIIGEKTDLYAQGYFVYDSKKAGAVTISHLRFSKAPIKNTYLIRNPNFVAVHNASFIGRLDVLEGITDKGTLLFNTRHSPEDLFSWLPVDLQRVIIQKKLKVYGIDATAISDEVGLRGRINIAMQTAFFKISGVLPVETFKPAIREAVEKTFGSKGKKIVDQNLRAMELAMNRIFEVPVPPKPVDTRVTGRVTRYDRSSPDAHFIEKVVLPVIANRGDTVPVSEVPLNGAVPLNTASLEKRGIAIHLPEWDPDVCIQCNQCSFVCPHSTIRPKLIYEDDLKQVATDEDFVTLKARGYKVDQSLYYRIQVAPDDCTGCGACAEVCPGVERDPDTKKLTGHKALTMRPKEDLEDYLRKTWKIFEELPDSDVSLLKMNRFKDVQFLPEYFEFAGACAGCGETPYIRLVTRLFGDRMYIANATGCSSIYGGTMPIVPYRKNERGEGVAWQSSLFEDNAEFGLGMRLAADKLRESAFKALNDTVAVLKDSPSGRPILEAALKVMEDSPDTAGFRESVYALEDTLASSRGRKEPLAVCRHLDNLASLSSYLLKKIVWIVGGDGWAYDIGYGGLDHVVASDADINILVLDTGVYSNTGGQCSKATPLGAVAKFAQAGKRMPRKELGLMAMSYKTAYVAQVAYGANMNQTLRAIQEAADFPGPSLVIAYAQCIEHGYSLNMGPEHQKLAVQSGFWPIYRFDPRRIDSGENPLQFDGKEPTADVADLIRQERRFMSLTLERPEEAEKVFSDARKAVARSHRYFMKLASLPFDDFRIDE